MSATEVAQFSCWDDKYVSPGKRAPSPKSAGASFVKPDERQREPSEKAVELRFTLADLKIENVYTGR